MLTAPVRQALAAYRKNEVSDFTLLRALVEHADWHVQLHLAAPLGTKRADGGIDLPGRVVLNSQHPAAQRPTIAELFTDAEALAHAVASWGGDTVGNFVAGVPGVALFEHLAAPDAAPPYGAIGVLHVNAGTPEVSFGLSSRADLRHLWRWTSTVRLERALAAPATPELVARLKSYDSFAVPEWKAQQKIVTLDGDLGLAHPAVVFTAPDLWQRFEATLPASTRAAIDIKFLDGTQLLARLPSWGVDGVVFNPGSEAHHHGLPLRSLG